MTLEIRKSLTKRKEFYDQSTKETVRSVDLLTCYLLMANEKIKDTESLTFHCPVYSAKEKRYDVLNKKGVKSFNRKIESLFDYLSDLLIWNTRTSSSFSVTGLKETLRDLEESPINKRVTNEAVINKYKEYQDLKEKHAKKEAIKIFLEKNLLHHP